MVSRFQNSIFSFFSIQLDKTTDVDNVAQICVYVLYAYDKHLEDEFWFCKTLNVSTTARKIFYKAYRFFYAHDIKWENAIGLCSDGAPAMLGCRSGFQALDKQKFTDISIHCTIHRQALSMKTVPDE